MTMFGLFRRAGTAPVARERLQVLLAHERATAGHADLIERLHGEIIAVIARHVSIDDDKVSVDLERGDIVSLLRVDIELSISQNPALGRLT